MKLVDIADIRTGLVISRKKAGKSSKDVSTYKLLTLRSIDPDGFIDVNTLDDFVTDQYISSEYITQEGDVVVRLSEPNTAVYIDTFLAGVIIPSLFAIIRLKEKNVNPSFLAWLLNSKYAKRSIRKSLIGSVIQVINTSVLEEIKIRLPSLQKQIEIIEIFNLYLKEKILLNQLMKQKEILYKNTINQIYERSN